MASFETSIPARSNIADSMPSQRRNRRWVSASAEQSIEANLARIAAAFAATEPSPDHPLARLLAELVEGRERIDAATRTFDAAMELYNSELTTFPNRLFAAVLHIAPGRMLARTAESSGQATG